jgi:hypothetical protein
MGNQAPQASRRGPAGAADDFSRSFEAERMMLWIGPAYAAGGAQEPARDKAISDFADMAVSCLVDRLNLSCAE